MVFGIYLPSRFGKVRRSRGLLTTAERPPRPPRSYSDIGVTAPNKPSVSPLGPAVK
jgi:hypothetical protein